MKKYTLIFFAVILLGFCAFIVWVISDISFFDDSIKSYSPSFQKSSYEMVEAKEGIYLFVKKSNFAVGKKFKFISVEDSLVTTLNPRLVESEAYDTYIFNDLYLDTACIGVYLDDKYIKVHNISLGFPSPGGGERCAGYDFRKVNNGS